MFDDAQDDDKRPNTFVDASDFIVDIREYDVPYHVRVSIDKGQTNKPQCIFEPSNPLQTYVSVNGIPSKQNTASQRSSASKTD